MENNITDDHKTEKFKNQQYATTSSTYTSGAHPPLKRKLEHETHYNTANNNKRANFESPDLENNIDFKIDSRLLKDPVPFPDLCRNLICTFTEARQNYREKNHVFTSIIDILKNEIHDVDDRPVPVVESKYFGNKAATSSINELPDKINEEKLPYQPQASMDASMPLTKSVIFNEPKNEPMMEILSSSQSIQLDTTNLRPITNIASSPVHMPKLEQPSAFASASKRLYGTLQLATQAQPPNHSSTSEHASAEQINKTKHVKPIVLSREQELVAELARQGHNIFYTGSAGTGKSLLLRKLITNLKEQHPPDTIGVTASTGLAAYNIGGMTINSYTGIGLGKGKVEDMLRNIKRNKKIRDRWEKMKVLIIDEISMIDGNLLDKLDTIGRRLNDAKKPFGGIQVIFCGDFYQLPPVSKSGDTIFAFQSNVWKNHIKVQVILKKVFRQIGDKIFLDMLQDVRNGQVSAATEKKFKYLKRPIPPEVTGSLIPTKLFPTRKEVDIANRKMMDQLSGGMLTYNAYDSGSLAGKPQGEKMLDSFLAPKSITLKAGAQVMMIKNIDETLVNGSLGTVVGFLSADTYNTYTSLSHELDLDNKEDADSYGLRKKLEEPNHHLEDSIFDFLKDAKAKILEELENNKDKDKDAHEKKVLPDKATVSEETETSEYKPSETSTTEDTSKLSIEVDNKPRVDERLAYIERKEEVLKQLNANESGKNVYPLVCFRLANGKSRTVLVERESFSVEDDFHRPLVARSQIPLMLAWALSIHKAQGQTLKLVSVDLKRIFENGQAYVALSRAEQRRGLQVLNFESSKIRTDPRVKQFYANLKDVETVYKNLKSFTTVNASDDGLFTNGPAGFHTQVKHLQDFTASPERFAKYAKSKKKVPDITALLSQKRLSQEQSKGEITTPTKHNKENLKPLEISKPDAPNLSNDMLLSEDEQDSFARLFEGN